MLSFLAHDGKMAQAIIDHDWSGSSVGAPETWSAVMKTTVATVLGSRFPQCIVWGEDLLTIPNDAFLEILQNKPAALGRSFAQVWSEVWPDIRPIVERCYAGEPTFIRDYALTIERGHGPEPVWFTFCYSPIRDEMGKVVGMLDTVVETTATVQARLRSDVIARELVHRVKNALTVAQAIAVQSMRGDVTMNEARDRISERIETMARTHDVLLHSEWNEASVEDIVRHALDPHLQREDCARVEGPRVMVSGRQALSLALAVHELATNAAKYGALSCEDGKLDIGWALTEGEDGATFEFTWTESDGPAVVPPKRKGFGSRLVTRVLPADFGGNCDVAYEPDGVRMRLRSPGDRLPTRVGG